MSVMRILSLGAGVQSSTLALMAAHGEIEPVEHAIFADTQSEPASVYRWLDWLEAEIAKCPHPFPVHRVTEGNLGGKALEMRTTKDGRMYSKTDIPFFTVSQASPRGKIQNRGCTRDYKLVPLRRKTRELANIKRGEKSVRVHQVIGISMDEAVRMKPARDPWCQNVYPLVDRGIRRHDCIAWMNNHGYPEPPRSSCYFCPYHNNREWRRLRDDEPEYFAAAVAFERDLQHIKSQCKETFASIPYLHVDRVPLDQVDLSTAEDAGQIDLFGNECEGMCGV